MVLLPAPVERELKPLYPLTLVFVRFLSVVNYPVETIVNTYHQDIVMQVTDMLQALLKQNKQKKNILFMQTVQKVNRFKENKDSGREIKLNVALM